MREALNAHSAFLIDAQSGEVLYAYNEHDKMQPASLAKMMTFYLTLEALKQKRIALDTPGKGDVMAHPDRLLRLPLLSSHHAEIVPCLGIVRP